MRREHFYSKRENRCYGTRNLFTQKHAVYDFSGKLLYASFIELQSNFGLSSNQIIIEEEVAVPNMNRVERVIIGTITLLVITIVLKTTAIKRQTQRVIAKQALG